MDLILQSMGRPFLKDFKLQSNSAGVNFTLLILCLRCRSLAQASRIVGSGDENG